MYRYDIANITVAIGMVLSLHICEFVVIGQSCLSTCVLETVRGSTKISVVLAILEIGCTEA